MEIKRDEQLSELFGVPTFVDPAMPPGMAQLRSEMGDEWRGISPVSTRACLVCTAQTSSEGQLCPACVERGHHVVNDTLCVDISPDLSAFDRP